MSDQGEDERGDGGEQLLVVAEEDPKSFRDGEDELSVRECEEELLVEVFGEQKGSLLRAGRAKVESLAGKRTKILEAACRIGALDTGDTLGVVAAAFETPDENIFALYEVAGITRQEILDRAAGIRAAETAAH